MLQALANRVQFIVYDKGRKVPVHPEKLFNIDPHDPANWLTSDVASAWAKFLGDQYGVGIVLWKGCGIACIDIDKALVNGEWTPLARELCSRFAGAYQEVSPGMHGVHIFFSYRNDIPPHRKKNVPLHIEFYDELRFVGVSGFSAAGDVRFDATDLLPKLIADYFPAAVEVNADGWTIEPAAGWDGPADDDELIRRMCASKSAGAVFGQKASVFDLFTGNVAALAVAFPPQSVGKDYDASSADQAFANHLAFWTGGNCERMAAIMLRSALARPKWERLDYFRGTIAKAAAWQKTYYKQRDPVPDIAPVIDLTKPAALTLDAAQSALTVSLTVDGIALPPNEAPAAPAPEVGHGSVITAAAQVKLFEGCLYVQDVNQIMVSEGNTLKREPFDNDERFRGRTFVVTRDGSAPTDSAWQCFTQSKLVSFPMVRGTYFEPREEPGAIMLRNGLKFVNTWRDPKIPATPGDPAPYLEHIKKIFPLGDDALIYLCFVAACVQNLGVKAAWSLFIQGVPGNGKSFLTKVMTYCLGEEYVHSASATNLDNHFNGYLYRKLLICVEEVKTTEGNAQLWEKLKTMITETRQEIEMKGVDQITREVCFNLIFNSNHKDGLRKTADDRRICPLFCAQQTAEDLLRDGMDEAYFIRLWDWYDAGGAANILHFLRTFEIPDKLNFAKGARRAPKTTATEEAITAGLGSVEQDILEAISAGRVGFKGGWIASSALQILLTESGKGKFIARNKRRDMLQALGYVTHPMLPDGRMTLTMTDGNKPTLYVKRGHSSAEITDAMLIKHLYESAQRA
jgi:hypothetical protein